MRDGTIGLENELSLPERDLPIRAMEFENCQHHASSTGRQTTPRWRDCIRRKVSGHAVVQDNRSGGAIRTTGAVSRIGRPWKRHSFVPATVIKTQGGNGPLRRGEARTGYHAKCRETAA